MTKQECESMLYDEFDKFISEPGESIHSYYLRYAKLINDMNMIPMYMSPMQINTKFVNHHQPEWSRFVTVAKQARDLHTVNFDQLYAFLKHNERDAEEGQVTVQNVQDRGSVHAQGSQKRRALGFRALSLVAPRKGANQPRVIRCYNCNGEGHIVILNDEQHDFLTDSLEETDDCEDLQLQAIINFKADHVDAYDSGCDDKATTNAIFMESLSPIGSINGDTVEPHYDSDILSEVPHYDTYHDSVVLNPSVQEM
ncbi:hypothetical protein Tco_0713713 [Tanacetum coccineum]